MDHDKQLLLVDIADPDFRAEIWGLSKQDVETKLHVLANGVWLTDLDAVLAVWKAIGKRSLLLWLAKFKISRIVMAACVFGVSKIRPSLPRRSSWPKEVGLARVIDLEQARIRLRGKVSRKGDEGGSEKGDGCIR
tara:strand:- start:216 stop:620 length:405 start_codon:yes stop_codon:yes gene_type:complete